MIKLAYLVLGVLIGFMLCAVLVGHSTEAPAPGQLTMAMHEGITNA